MAKKKKEFIKYPHIPNLETMHNPNARILLGKTLYWTKKYDGSCLSFWLNKNKEIQISSRNMSVAAPDLQEPAKQTAEYPKIVQLIKDYPNLIVYAELCRKGRSVTGVELYDHTFLVVFDMYDKNAEKFLPYINTHQYCFHYNIPIVELYARTRHRSMKDLLKFRNHVLEYCRDMHFEGMVIKTFGEYMGKQRYIQAKVKLDIPRPVKIKIAKGEPIYPPIPKNEIMGAIAKVEADFGLTGNPKDDMPRIAEYVKKEMKKHLYSKPQGKNLFKYYKEYLEKILKA